MNLRLKKPQQALTDSKPSEDKTTNEFVRGLIRKESLKSALI